MAVAYGVDLGTTYTKCALVRPDDKQLMVFKLDREDPSASQNTHHILRSAVTVGVEGGRNTAWVGARSSEIVVARGEEDASSTLRRFEEAKMYIGEESGSDDEAPPWPFEPHGWDYRPEDIGAIVLRKVKQEAERANGPSLERIVITHPQYFNDARRHATKQAAEIAGVEVLDMMTEPDAAALAFQADASPGAYMVFDMGGGTLDVTLCQVEPGALTVLSSDGTKLAGRDFDRVIFGHMVEQYHAMDADFDVSKLNGATRQAWMREAERVKRQLNEQPLARAMFRCDNAMFSGPQKKLDFSHEWFEQASQHILQASVECAESALSRAGMSWGKLQGVLCVGGSTRLKLVQQALSKASGRTLSVESLDVDTAIARGAALRAHQLVTGKALPKATGPAPATEAPAVKLTGVLARGLGIKARSPAKGRDIIYPLATRGTQIPWTKSFPKVFRSKGKGTTSLNVELYEGDSEDPADCVLVGTVKLTGFEPSEQPQPVEVSLEVEGNGRKHLKVMSGGKATEAVIEFDTKRVLAPAEIQRRRDFVASLRIF